MSFSVGILYSAQEFATFIRDTPVTPDQFKHLFKKFSLARPEDILSVATRCNWVDVQLDGICRITPKGKRLLEGSAEKILRTQLHDVIDAEQPSWSGKIPHGRQEAMRFLPDEVTQCFREAGLLKTWNDEIIDWWDQLAMASRNRKVSNNLVTGRTAERLSIKFEVERIGLRPHWQSLESNFSGYDLLSRVEMANDTHRMIEVKGSTLKKKEAFCFITRNEWETAKTAPDYHFHLWCIREQPLLIDVSREMMSAHIPADIGEGAWETVKIFFRSFPDSMCLHLN